MYLDGPPPWGLQFSESASDRCGRIHGTIFWILSSQHPWSLEERLPLGKIYRTNKYLKKMLDK